MTRHTPNWLQAGSYSAALDRDLVAALWPNGASNAGLLVTVQSGMTVQISAGRCAVVSPNNTGAALCTSDAVETVTLAAAPASGSNRYDLIVAQPRGSDWDGSGNTDFIFTNVTGTAAASPTLPAVPAGTYCIAQVYVPGASASVVAGNIIDRRIGALAAAARPVFRGHVATQLSQANGVSTVLWESVDEDTDGAWTPASGTYTFKRAGLWSASMLTNWDGTLSTGQRSPAFNIVNATPASPSIGQIFGTFAAAVNDPAGNGRQAFGISFRVRPGDTMQFQVYQNTNQSIWLRPQSWGECHWVCD